MTERPPSHHPLCECGSLLIFTEHFVGKQWLCMRCGLLYSYPPRKQPWSPAAEQRQSELGDEFYLNCGNHLICKGQYRLDCTLCQGPPEQEHMLHASPRDWQLCNDALKWLSDRTGREFVFVNGDLLHSGKTRPVTIRTFTDEILRGGI